MTNTPERVTTPAADFLADCGKFLYGKSDWLGPFAANLDVKPSWLSNALKGRAKLLGNHPVLKRALRLVEERLEQQRDGWRAKCEELEDAAMPDAPANDDLVPVAPTPKEGRQMLKTVERQEDQLRAMGAVVRRHK